MTRAWLALLISAVLLGLPEAGVGHGVLVESRPRAGESLRQVRVVDLRFNSRIEPVFSRVRLVGPSPEPLPFQAGPYGAAEPNRLRAALPELGPGQYTVHWRVLTVDGHITEGVFSFRIRPAS